MYVSKFMIIQRSKTKLRQPYLICSWPGLGMVGNYVINYIIHELRLNVYAEIDEMHEFYFPKSVIVENGTIYLPESGQNKFYYYRTDESDFLFFVCDVQPSSYLFYEFAEEFVDFAESLNVKMLITFAAIPTNILHTDKPKLYIAKNNPQINLPSTLFTGVNNLRNGVIDGMNGVILGIAKERDIDGICILSEIPIYTLDFDNPQAGLKILTLLEKLFLFKFKLDRIYKDINKADEKIKTIFIDLNQKAQKLMTQFDSAITGQDGSLDLNFRGVSFEDLKKQLKFSLPESAKNKIEELFSLATKDSKYIKDLKAELDKWDVYKDYEDRFLSLFLKNKKKGDEPV